MALRTERDRVAHLLRRFGLGASEAELDYYLQGGQAAAINKLLDYESVEEPFEITQENLKNDGRLIPNPRLAQGVFYARIMATVRPLEMKMTLFWHDHFALSADKVSFGPSVYNYVEVLRQNATGTFLDLLTAVSKCPAMLYWLDNQENVKGKPNENFAREVMELFTLGIGNYTEKDIQEAAKAFTGWAYGTERNGRKFANRGAIPGPFSTFIFDQNNHEPGTKTVLGKSGDLDGDAVLKHLCSLPRTAQYITEKIWAWFAYPNPEKAVVERIAGKFIASGLQIKALLRAVMESPEFYSDKAERAIIKNPMDYAVPTLRQLGIGQAVARQLADTSQEAGRRGLAPAALAKASTTNMGMELMYPPDVSGWTSGDGWISTSTMVERIKWASVLFGQVQRPNGQGDRPANVQRNMFPAMGLFVENPTAEGVVSKVCSLFDVSLPQAKIDELVVAARKECGNRVTAQNANKTAEAVSKLVFATPEFQFM